MLRETPAGHFLRRLHGGLHAEWLNEYQPRAARIAKVKVKWRFAVECNAFISHLHVASLRDRSAVTKLCKPAKLYPFARASPVSSLPTLPPAHHASSVSKTKGRGGQRLMQVNMSARTMFVLVPLSPLFAAHWSLFVPDDASDESHSVDAEQLPPVKGRRMHVSGDRLNGSAL